MSLVHLRCGVRAGAIVCGLAGIALASTHFASDGFSEDFVVAAVIGLILVAGIWLMTEAFYTSNAEATARHKELCEALTDAEAIGAWALNAAFTHSEGDGAQVASLNGHRRR